MAVYGLGAVEVMEDWDILSTKVTLTFTKKVCLSEFKLFREL
jgi:hypothetical protein